MTAKSLIEQVAEERAAERMEKEAREALLKKRANWHSLNFITLRLEGLENGPLPAMQEEYERFERDLVELSAQRTRLGELNRLGLEADFRAIEANLNNPDKLTDIKRDITNLKKKVEKLGEKLKKEAEEKEQLAKDKALAHEEQLKKYSLAHEKDLKERAMAHERYMKEQAIAHEQRLKEQAMAHELRIKEENRLLAESQVKREEERRLRAEQEAKAREEETKKAHLAIKMREEQRLQKEQEFKETKLKLMALKAEKKERQRKKAEKAKEDEAQKAQLAIKMKQEQRLKKEQELKERKLKFMALKAEKEKKKKEAKKPAAKKAVPPAPAQKPATEKANQAQEKTKDDEKATSPANDMKQTENIQPNEPATPPVEAANATEDAPKKAAEEPKKHAKKEKEESHKKAPAVELIPTASKGPAAPPEPIKLTLMKKGSKIEIPLPESIDEWEGLFEYWDSPDAEKLVPLIEKLGDKDIATVMKWIHSDENTRVGCRKLILKWNTDARYFTVYDQDRNLIQIKRTYIGGLYAICELLAGKPVSMYKDATRYWQPILDLYNQNRPLYDLPLIKKEDVVEDGETVVRYTIG